MSKKVFGNVDIQGNSFEINEKQAIRSVNTVPVSSTGNVTITSDEINIDGIDGKTIFLGENTNIFDNSCKIERIVDSEIELNQDKQIVINLDEVYSTWKRISHAYTDWPSYPASASEVNSWTYNSSNGTINNNTNSTTFLGFVSPTVYTKYDFEVKLTSTDNDDDFIGLILAYTEINGIQYTLYAARRLVDNASSFFDGGGVSRGNYTWSVYYNFFQGSNTGAEEYRVADGTSFVPQAPVGSFWSNYTNGVKIRATRDGDLISVNVSQLNTENYVYNPLEIDLNSDPRLYKFKNPSSIGYGTLSQASSTFKNSLYSGDKNIIYYTVDNSVYYYDNNSWILSDVNMYDLLPSGSLYSNPNTNKLFYINNNQTTTLVAGLSVGTGEGQVPSMLNFDSIMSDTGYQKLPNGMIMQWVTITGNGISASVILPTPFPNKLISAYCVSNVDSPTSISKYNVNMQSSTNTTIVVSGRYFENSSFSSSGIINCKVFAIGY